VRGVAFPSAAASHKANNGQCCGSGTWDAVGTKVAVLTAEVRLAGVLCGGSGLAPVSQNFRLSIKFSPGLASTSSPAATPPSTPCCLLPRIPSLPSGGVLGGYVLSSIFWGGSGEKAVSRFVQSKIASPVPIGSPQEERGSGAYERCRPRGPRPRRGSWAHRKPWWAVVCMLRWGQKGEADGTAFTHAVVCAGSRDGLRRLVQDGTGVLG
jgi:hypothetical protein